LSFGYAAHCGITAHLRNGLHVHGNQQNFGTHVSGGGGGFTACVPGTYYNYIVLCLQILKFTKVLKNQMTFINLDFLVYLYSMCHSIGYHSLKLIVINDTDVFI